MERIIEIAVRGLNAVQTNDMEYVCDNTDYIAEFDFDEEWDGVDPKTARFVYGEEHQDIVFTGDRCEIPRISDVNSMRVGVFAGNLVTTTPAQVICRRSILGKSSLPADPTPDVYAQIMEVAFPAAVAEAEESARQAAESEQNAKASETNAEQSAKDAAESAKNLNTAEQSAKESATQAATSEANAKTSEGNAKTSENNAKASETSASGSASNANLAKENAEKAKTAAEAAATRAENARQGIEQFVSGAEQSASTATAAAQKAGQHEANAKTAEQNANTSAQNAAQSASDAKTSADEAFAERTEARRLVDVCAAYSKSANNSASYASDAKTEIQKSEQNIIDSAGIATASAAVAAQSEQNAKTAENNAKASEQNAAASAESAAQTLQSIDDSKKSAAASAAAAAQSAQAAKTSEGNAKASETNAAQSATEAKQAAESVNLPTPTPETAGKAVIVNEDGTGFEFGEAPSSGGGAQSDWNAAEGEPGHILNRTHWMEKQQVEMLPEITVALSNGEGAVNQPIGLVVGEVYDVTYNGTKYTCTAMEIDVGEGVMTAAVGNAAFTGADDTGEPFVLIEVPPDLVAMMGANGMIADMSGASECTISVAGQQNVVHKIPHEYIHNSDWNASIAEPGHILNRTHYAEIVAVDFSTENVMATDGAIMQPVPVLEGCTYTVTWNGVDYECTAFTHMGMLLLGDVGLIHGTTVTGEPFVIVIFEEPEDGVYAHAYPKESASEISLTIRGTGERVHKLDAKFVDFDPMASMETVDFSANGAAAFAIGSGMDAHGEAETFREQLRKGFIKVKFSLEYIKSSVPTVETYTMLLVATSENHAFGMVCPTHSNLLCFVSMEVYPTSAKLSVWPGFTKRMTGGTESDRFKAPVICDKNGNYYGLMVNDSGNLETYSLGEI